MNKKFAICGVHFYSKKAIPMIVTYLDYCMLSVKYDCDLYFESDNWDSIKNIWDGNKI